MVTLYNHHQLWNTVHCLDDKSMERFHVVNAPPDRSRSTRRAAVAPQEEEEGARARSAWIPESPPPTPSCGTWAGSGHKSCGSSPTHSSEATDNFVVYLNTGWPVRLITKFCWHQIESCICVVYIVCDGAFVPTQANNQPDRSLCTVILGCCDKQFLIERKGFSYCKIRTLVERNLSGTNYWRLTLS